MRAEMKERIRSEVAGRIFERCLSQTRGRRARPLAEVINETLYHEGERLRMSGSAVRAEDRAMHRLLRRELPKANDPHQQTLLKMVLDNYIDEVIGNFNPAVYALATRAVPLGLTALLTGLSPRRLLGGLGRLPSVTQQIVIDGKLERLKRLQKQGTLVYVPTHTSNLDSVLLGYAIYRLGLPPVIYGAGLNLFSNPITGFFMHNLGAYTVDRTKTDPLYRQVLKEYATVTLENGFDNLFFPGGTRIRSGGVETKLKRGLLGTGVWAYRNNLAAGRKRPKIFVIPVTISYPLVLEGATLIDDHLKREGRARYIIADDEFSHWRRWTDFFNGLVNMDQRIHLRFGTPLDPFGNPVDDDGNSLDARGRTVDPAGYLRIRGRVREDPVRDREYTNLLAERIVDEFRAWNTAQATNVLAFAVFEGLRRRSDVPDLYRFLRSLGPETSLAQEEVERTVEELLTELRDLEVRGLISLAPEVARGSARDLTMDALRSFGTYHTRPVIERRGVRLHAGDPNLIFFYRNRLDGYRLMGTRPLLEPGGLM